MFFNINDQVTVTLTAKGADIMNAYEREWSLFDSASIKTWKEGDTYKRPLYIFMCRFGDQIGIGFDIPFKPQIELHPEEV